MSLEEFPEIQKLSKEEKLQLVTELWDDIAAMPDDLPISKEEKDLLDARSSPHQNEVWRADVRSKIEQGMNSLQAGQSIPTEQVQSEMASFKKTKSGG